MLAGQQILGEQESAVAAEGGAEEDSSVAGKDESHGQVQGLGEQGIEEIVGVEDEIDAQRVVDQVAVQGRGQIVDERVFEVPDVPDEGGFVVGPLGHAGHRIKDAQGQGPGEDDGQERKES